jgi:hypothetical protein
VAFNQHIAAIAVYPTVSNPVRTWMGPTIPAAGNPDIMGAVPAMITTDPFKFRPRSVTTRFDDGGGRSYVDHDLCKRGSR